MRVVIVGRDRDALKPLVEKLTRQGFEILWAENSSAVQALIRKKNVHFVLADYVALMRHGLAKEILKRCPLARVVALVVKPSRLDFIDALAAGLTDYFPKRFEHFDELVELLVYERQRMTRWQKVLLSSNESLAIAETGLETEVLLDDDL